MSYSGGRLETDIPDVDLASFTLRGAHRMDGKPALIDGQRLVVAVRRHLGELAH